MSDKVFENRKHAGRELAGALEHLRAKGPVVVGLPRGGVVVACEIAAALDAPLEVVVARKIGAPDQPEFAMGAVAPTGARYVDAGTVRMLGVSDEEVDRLAEAARREAESRMERYGGEARLARLNGRHVIVADDGLATGSTARVAVDAAREAGAGSVTLAAPVGAPDTVARFRSIADEVVCLSEPAAFRAVGLWYREFGQTSDEEVMELLENSRRAK